MPPPRILARLLASKSWITRWRADHASLETAIEACNLILYVLANLFIDSLQRFSVVSEPCVTLGALCVTDPHPCTIVAEDVATKESNGVDCKSWRTIELETTEMVLAQLTCPRSFRQLADFYEGRHGLTSSRHVGMIAVVRDVLIVVFVSVVEFRICFEDARDREDEEVDGFI